jgi:hypothetical protein
MNPKPQKRYILDELSAAPVVAHSVRPLRAWADGIPPDVILDVNQGPREPDCVAVVDGQWGYINQGSLGGFMPAGPAYTGGYPDARLPPPLGLSKWQKAKMLVVKIIRFFTQ